MKLFLKLILGIILVSTLSILGYFIYLNYLAPEPPSTETIVSATPQTTSTTADSITTEARVIPKKFVELSFSVPGIVDRVLITQGDYAEVGQVLGTLEGSEQIEASIQASQLELAYARRDLEDLYKHEKLMMAQAQQAVVESQEAVKEAERILTNLLIIPTQSQIEAAEVAVEAAENAMAQGQKKLNDLERKISSRPELDARIDPEFAVAKLALHSLEKNYLAAVSYLNALKNPPDELDIARAEANLAVAQAKLDEAQENYEILQNGPDPDDVALAEARVSNAEANIIAAQTSLDNLTLVAPISGQIVFHNLKAGELVNPNLTQVILADLSIWQVETTDLTETDVARLYPGLEATIKLNAFPDHKFKGVVAQIDMVGAERRGSITYVVTLEFDPGDIPLRWEMTAIVEFPLP